LAIEANIAVEYLPVLSNSKSSTSPEDTVLHSIESDANGRQMITYDDRNENN